MSQDMRHSRRLEARSKGSAGTQVGSPKAPCMKQRQNPSPPKQKPCDIDKIQIKCKHCGKKDEREDFKEGVFQFSAQEDRVKSNYPRLPGHKQPNESIFEVTANSKGEYRDEISINITRAACHDPSDHPAVTITKPDQMHELPLYYKGKTQVTFPVAYPSNWWKRILAAAKKQPGFDAIRGLFYPSPVTYAILVQSCCYRGPNQARWGVWAHKILVYPDDVFKLSISIPPFKKKTKLSEGGARGSQEYSSRESKTEKGWSGTSESYKTEQRKVHKGDSSQRYESLYEHTTVQDRKGGLASEREVVFHESSGKLMYVSKDEDPGKADSFGKAVVSSIKFTHNATDVTYEVSIAKLIKRIIEIRKETLDALEFIRSYAAKVPKIGWSLEYSVEILSGSIDFEWGWKEWDKGNTVFAYAKAEASLTLIEGALTLSFGVEILGAIARIYGMLKGSVALNGTWELDPNKKAMNKDALSFRAVGLIEGELAVEGALGHYVILKGSLKAGIEADSDINFHPFKWTLKIDRTKAKVNGKVEVHTHFGTFSHEEEYELWGKAPLLSERRIM